MSWWRGDAAIASGPKGGGAPQAVTGPSIIARKSRTDRTLTSPRHAPRQPSMAASELSRCALKRVMTALMKDNIELFKQFMDNDGFKRWMTDTVFDLSYGEGSEPSA